MPPSIKFKTPMLATLVEKPFDSPDWIFEIKWDGYRALAYKKNEQLELLSRNNKSFLKKFPDIVDELKNIPGEFILDGEIVILDEHGKSKFQLLQNYQKRKEGTPYYYVFDTLSLNGKDLTGFPLVDRKKTLQKFLKSAKHPHIRYSENIDEDGIDFFKEAAKHELEGIIAKKKDSTYQFRRSQDWLKIKCKLRQEVVIGGYTAPSGSRKRFGALLVGLYDNGKLRYAGHVGGGFDENLLDDVFEQLQKKLSPKCPFSEQPHTNNPVTWVKPVLVCEVEFAEWTDEGIMRQPIFKGMRIDKKAKDVVKEKPTLLRIVQS